MWQEFMALINDLGLSESTLMYLLVGLILVIAIVGFLLSGADLKSIYKVVAGELVNEAEASGVTVESLFDSIFKRVKDYLRTPNTETGKVPKINRVLIILISLPLVKSMCIKAVKKHIEFIKSEKKIS